MILHNYFRSSASFRVRIALALKGLPYDYVSVHLAKGDHKLAAYTDKSADGLVPLLEVNENGRGESLSQSMAIIEYIDETYANSPLMPKDALGRAKVRALAQSISCEIHPLNNLRVLKYLVKELKQDEATKNAWYVHWCREGLEAFERQLAGDAAYRAKNGQATSVYCFGSTPTLADCCLVPQIFNAQRFNVPFDGLPLTMAAFDACMKLDAFQAAQPSKCPDFEA
jgi:maleylacetoacetate isomerase/maleylpyruvate isomerase